MQIKDRAEYKSKSKPTTMRKTDKVRKAIDEMSKYNYGCVVITNTKNEIEGIVSERDLMTRLLQKRLDPDKTKLADIMSTDVKVARDTDQVVDWLRIMSNERFRHLPVVDENNKLVNLMSQGDFVSYTWPSLISNLADKTKEGLSLWYQVPLILFSLVVYAWIVHLLG